MQNFRTLGLMIKKVRHLFNLSDKYGKIIRCGSETSKCREYGDKCLVYQFGLIFSGETVSFGLLSLTISLFFFLPDRGSPTDIIFLN